MKFFNSLGPNPRIVRIFLAEKGVELPEEQVDLMGGENRGSAYMKKNPAGQLPALELDDGTIIAESTVICEYLEERHPEPNLLGNTSEERASIRMWIRRLDYSITENVYNGFRFSEGLELFKDRVHVIPQAAEDLKSVAQENISKLDTLIAGRDFIAGNRFTLADIPLYCCLDFSQGVGQGIDSSLKNLTAWHARVGSRSSAEGSLHPAATQAGMRA